ncbi:hypothetical protein ACSW9O_15905 (plasmid) [Clostridium perfringens]|nr:hypothetical protein [Clostridium perfringens]
MDKYILREDYDNNELKEDQKRLRTFQKEIHNTERKGIEDEFKSYLVDNPTLTYEEQEAVRQFIKYELNKI